MSGFSLTVLQTTDSLTLESVLRINLLSQYLSTDFTDFGSVKLF